MSKTTLPVVRCDGCGTIIDTDGYLHIEPDREIVVTKSLGAERDFCCEACESWWKAQYPLHGPWGPAWEEREWWHHQLVASDYIPVRTTHDEMPLLDTRVHFEDPEPVG